jgi:spore germination protein KC
MWILIARENRAAEIFKVKADLNQMVSDQLEKMFKSHKSIGKFVKVPYWEVIEKLAAEGNSPVVPTIIIIEFNGRKIPQINGTAVFKKDKMVGWLNGRESKIFSWITEKNMNEKMYGLFPVL